MAFVEFDYQVYTKERMTNTYSLLRSKTFWTIVAMAVIGAGNALVPVIPVAYQAVIEVILGAVASMFHLSTATTAGATN